MTINDVTQPRGGSAQLSQIRSDIAQVYSRAVQGDLSLANEIRQQHETIQHAPELLEAQSSTLRAVNAVTELRARVRARELTPREFEKIKSSPHIYVHRIDNDLKIGKSLREMLQRLADTDQAYVNVAPGYIIITPHATVHEKALKRLIRDHNLLPTSVANGAGNHGLPFASERIDPLKFSAITKSGMPLSTEDSALVMTAALVPRVGASYALDVQDPQSIKMLEFTDCNVDELLEEGFLQDLVDAFPAEPLAPPIRKRKQDGPDGPNSRKTEAYDQLKLDLAHIKAETKREEQKTKRLEILLKLAIKNLDTSDRLEFASKMCNFI